MKIILHIGCEKTGTTTLQRFMRLNREALAARDICYPQSVGIENHTHLAVAAMSDSRNDTYLRLLYGIQDSAHLRRFREHLSSSLANETNQFGTVILSSEHCSSELLALEEVQRLKEMLLRLSNDIRVIVYLRRQDEFLASYYSTQVRLGAVHPIQIPKPQVIRERFDYYPILDRWAKNFEDLTVRIYDRKRFPKGSIIDDFLDACGISIDSTFALPDRENAALGRNQVEFLRLFNQYLPLMSGDELYQRRGYVGQLVDQQLQTGGKVALRSDDAKEFMRMLFESNALVADRFMGRREPSGDPLFGTMEKEDEQPEAQPLQYGKALSIFIDLMTEKCRSEGSALNLQSLVGILARIWQEELPESQQDRRTNVVLRNELAKLQLRTKALEQRIRAIEESSSWRVTKPLRSSLELFRKLKR